MNNLDIDPDKLAEANRLLNISREELFNMLVDELISISGEEQAFPTDQLRWIKDRYEIIKSASLKFICNNHLILSLCQSKDSHTRSAQFICIIADTIIINQYPELKGLPAFTVATLIVGEGLDKLCITYWNE